MVIKMTAQNNGQQDFPAVRFVFIFINTSLSEQCYNPCNFHRKNLKRYSARHNIKPYLTGCLRFSYRRCDYSDNYRKRTDTAGYVRYADKLKQSRVTGGIHDHLPHPAGRDKCGGSKRRLFIFYRDFRFAVENSRDGTERLAYFDRSNDGYNNDKSSKCCF